MSPALVFAGMKACTAKAWRFVAAYPLQALLILALLVCAWLWRAKSHLAAELAQARQTVGAIDAAEVQAAIDQVAVNHAPAILSQQIAENSDAHAPEYYAQVENAGLAYAAAHPVRLRCAQDQGQPGNAGMFGADSAAQVDDGSGEAPGMVAVTRADFDLLTANSGRLAKVHQDAQALIAAGVAVAAEDQAQ